jgi:hypothetical protein
MSFAIGTAAWRLATPVLSPAASTVSKCWAWRSRFPLAAPWRALAIPFASCAFRVAGARCAFYERLIPQAERLWEIYQKEQGFK